jgi:hypothetical protein
VVALIVPVNLLIFRRILPRQARRGQARRELPDGATLRRYIAGDYAAQLFSQPPDVPAGPGRQPARRNRRRTSCLHRRSSPGWARFDVDHVGAVVEAAKDPAHAHRHA